MRDALSSRATTAVQRLTVVVDSALLDALQAHLRQVESDTRLRVSLSQVAGSLMRRGLDSTNASPSSLGPTFSR
jgi:hypothetical protein